MNHLEGAVNDRLIQFLKEELAVSDAAIATIRRHREFSTNLLPMLLWQYGLVTLQELDQIFEWLETV